MNFEGGARIATGEGVEDMGEQAGAEADHAESAVLDIARTHAGALDHAGRRLRLVAKDEAQRVGIMDGDVHHHAGAGLGVLDPPALQMLGKVHGRADAGEERPADLAGRSAPASAMPCTFRSICKAGGSRTPRPAPAW